MTHDAADRALPLSVRFDGREWTVSPGSTLRIGRAGDCQLVPTDERVSRQHGHVAHEDGTWVYHSLGANGTFRDGRRLPPRMPVHGLVELRLGHPQDGEHLVLEPRPLAGHTVDVRGAAVTRLGRATDNDVVVEDLLASRYHARIRRGSHGQVLDDLDSLNGTQLNGAPVDSAPVADGDVITIGTTRFRLEGGVLVAVTSAPGSQALLCDNVTFRLADDKVLLDDVSFGVPPSSLLAVIGPSGAGKSTLLNVLTGARPASAGAVRFDQRDMHRARAEMRQRVGLVPQEDVVHRMLTIRRALGYAAELRFPADLGAPDRGGRVQEVLAELSLMAHADTRIDRLSGGQRKRASVALELLTRPSLLFLDEPTSGLDPGLDKQVMTTLRDLADGGRIVVVVTHSVDNLDLCDLVLLLGPGGKVAYYGPPQGLLEHFERERYADVFVDVAADPVGYQGRFVNSGPGRDNAAAVAALRQSGPSPESTVVRPRNQSVRRQVSTLLRRQVNLVVADRSYAVSMLVLPAILAALAWLVPGSTGLAQPAVVPSLEAKQVLLLMIIGSAFMGMAVSIRDLIGERTIFHRERAVGLSPGVYLVSKLVVYGCLVTVQSVILVALITLRKPAPTTSTLLGSGTLELVVACALCAFAAAALGLVFSALVTSSEQVMPILVVAIMGQMVLSGGLFPLVDRLGLEQLAWLSPSRWGYAAAAATVDLNTIAAVPNNASDPFWAPSGASWLRSAGLLCGLAAGYAALCLTLLKGSRR